MTMNVSPAVVAVDAGTSTDVTVNVQRMVDGPSDYMISGKSYEAGISVESVSGKFGDDGSGHVDGDDQGGGVGGGRVLPAGADDEGGQGGADVHAVGRGWGVWVMLDEHTRECLDGMVERSITGEHLIDELGRVATERSTFPTVCVVTTVLT